MRCLSKYNLLFFSLVVFININIKAQSINPDRPLRLEIDVKSNAEPFIVASIGEYGLLLFYQTTFELDEEKRVWNFSYFNRNFEEIWKKEIGIYDELEYIDYVYNQNAINLLFANTEKRSTENFQIISLKYFSNDDQQITGTLPRKAEISSYFNNDSLVYLGVDLKSEVVSVYRIDIESKNMIEFPIIQDGQASIADIKINPLNNHIDLVVFYAKKRENISLINYELSQSGKIVTKLSIIPKQENLSFYTAKIILFEENKKLITGTFNSDAQSKTKKSNNVLKETATGVYVATVQNDSLIGIQYYNFTDFQNFYKYLSETEVVRMKKKVSRREESGKKLNLNYRLLVHDPISFEKENILVVEAFRPEYRTVTNMSYDIYGRPMPTTYTVFEGYRYTNSFIVGFNNEGKII